MRPDHARAAARPRTMRAMRPDDARAAARPGSQGAAATHPDPCRPAGKPDGRGRRASRAAGAASRGAAAALPCAGTPVTPYAVTAARSWSEAAADFVSWYSCSTFTLQMLSLRSVPPAMFSTATIAVSIEWSWLL